VADRAIAKCGLDRDRRQLPPGDYEAVFEELAVAEILRIVSLTGLGGQSVREGRSFMSGRIGEQVTGDRLTLSDDALDPRTLAIPFDDEGEPKQRVVLIERGVAKGLYTVSALALLAGIELLGAQRLARDWWSSNGMGSVVCLVPPMKVRRATITGSSPA